jgi:type IV secretory pathway TrbD component
VWPAGVSLVGPTGATGPAGSIDTTALYNFTNAGGIQNNGNEVGFRDLPISRTQTGSFVLAAADRGKAILSNAAGSGSGQVPLNATVSIAVGSIITIANIGSGACAITRESGVTMNYNGANANRSLAAGGLCWVWKIATNTWIIGGSGLT